ncbi:uncharacterized protein LOC113862320 [Abrus precatorius]|uniref:Uncharacterized protein LOC113862320 n=1 Tax=Abrus precatorius TaxID=3816 RepID=A0A8B8L4T9_ABRPR|nr:uncharacterized protein LOC113862320 [Abrus precatorius]
MAFREEKPGQFWGELHPDLLDEIAKHISSYDDYVRLRAVNKSWNKALPKIPTNVALRGPWLVLPFDEEVYDHHLRLPELKNTKIRGSSFGWLIVVETGGKLRMLNPLTGSSFGLPPLSTFPNVLSYQPDEHGKEYTVKDSTVDNEDSDEPPVIGIVDSIHMQNMYIEKVVLSSAPDDQDKDKFMAVALYGWYPELAFYRFGDDKWTNLPFIDVYGGLGSGIRDVIFHQSKIYAVDEYGYLYEFEFDMKAVSGGRIWNVKRPRTSITICSRIKYLVRNPDGHLLMVLRYVDYGNLQLRDLYKTAGFDIFELDQSTGQWFRKFNLGSYVLILGYNLSTWKPPFADEKGNCARNCIYFTDNNLSDQFDDYGGHDIGVFNLEDKSISQPFPRSTFFNPPPVWL